MPNKSTFKVLKFPLYSSYFFSTLAGINTITATETLQLPKIPETTHLQCALKCEKANTSPDR